MTLQASAQSWPMVPAAFVESAKQNPEKSADQARPIVKVKPKPIVKCKPLEEQYDPASLTGYWPTTCMLPSRRPSGWELDAQGLFARVKGSLRDQTNAYAYYGTGSRDIDLNSQLGLPDHAVIPTFSARFRFKPNWSLRYTIMPMVVEGSGSPGSYLDFGGMYFSWGQNINIKWERLYQRAGVSYDPIVTPKSRVSVFGEYVRVDDKISVVQPGCCGRTMNSDLNMMMAGLELERCLKTTRRFNTLSLECKAGVAFLDEAFGGDISTGLRYSIPLNNGRWGYLSGGYRYMTYKKKYSDARALDSCIEGGYVQVGFIF